MDGPIKQVPTEQRRCYRERDGELLAYGDAVWRGSRSAPRGV